MTISTYSEGGHPRPKANSRNKQNKTTAATQVSGASNAGFLGNARSKLKGYLGSFKSKEDPDTSRLQSGAEGTNLLDIKTPKYRHYSSSSKSPATDAVTKNCPRQITSDQSPFTDSEDGEGKSHTYSVKTKYYDKEASSISSKKSKKKLTKKNSNEKKLSKKIDRPKTDDQKIHMFDLPWSDNRPNSRLQGWYSGPVDAKLLPHGKGTLILRGHETSKFFCIFEHGNLASSLICKSNDEAIFSASEICRTSNPPAPMNTSTRRRGQEPSGVLLYDETPLNRRHSQQDMLEQQRRSIKMPAQARRLSTGTFSQEEHYHFMLSATNPVSTPNNDSQQDMLEQQGRPIKMPTATRRATIDTAEYPMDIEQLPKPNDVEPKSLTRPHYNLGDIVRTPKHMITRKSDDEAIHSASLLKVNELAFLKRSNGLWTTAILADRSLQPTKQKQSRSAHWYSECEVKEMEAEDIMLFEESMLFVINEDGATKIVQRRHWGKYVRRMIVFESDADTEDKTEGHYLNTCTDEA